MIDNPIITTLRNKREELQLSKATCALSIGMSKGAFYTRENSGRFIALEQLERWASFLGFRVVLVPKEDEPI